MSTPEKPASGGEFARQGQQQRASLLGDFFYLLKNNRKWWMLPLLVLLVLFGVFMVLSSTGVAPFIYTVF